jgi:glycosyltransferase involved in cell wall biosynthesis
MHLVFVYPSPGIWGGIETQIVRMSHWLVSHGHRVSVITLSDRRWGELLPPEVRCLALGKKYWKLNYYFRSKRIWRSLGLPPPDVIKSFNWELHTAWNAYQLALITGAKAVAGFYGPRQLLREQRNDFFMRSFMHNVPERARIFMSPEQIEELQTRYGQGGELWLLPVDMNRFLPATRQPKPGHIVSIGRLGDMKGYNLYMIDVVAELLRRGHEVTWTVHGTGEYEAEMRARIAARHLEHVITLAGEMPYERCRQALADAHVFVGMGTTIVEASLFGVPNVLALAFDREGVTYGPLYRVPHGSVGDMRDGTPPSKVVDEIERILTLSAGDYAAECERVRQYAEPYSSDVSMQRFVEIVENAPYPQRKVWPCIENYLHMPMRGFAKLPRLVKELSTRSAAADGTA